MREDDEMPQTCAVCFILVDNFKTLQFDHKAQA